MPAKNGPAKVASQPAMPVGSKVGRANRSARTTVKPCPCNRAAYCSAVGRNRPKAWDGDTPRLRRLACRAVIMAATLPCPPISPTNRPPGLSTRATPAITPAASGIQCRAALENTASHCKPARSSAWPSMTRASRPRAQAARTMSGEASTPMTLAPLAAIFAVSAPSPQPRSRIVSPGCGASRSSKGAPSSATKPAFAP